jgi:hypothetical protein
MRKFSQKEDLFLLQNYKTIPAKRMSKILNRTEGTARQRMKLLGIVVPPEIIEKFKRESQYKKGREPENKGKKWKEFMSKAGMRNSKKTQFKKGTRPPNWKPVGFERINKDGYIEVKVGEGMHQFRHKHRIVYEKHYGKIPRGMIVRFKDGNKQNLKPSNLILITRGANMKSNSLHNYPKEISTTIQLLGALKRQINKNRKKLSNEK